MSDQSKSAVTMPDKAPTAVLVLEDGAVYYGQGIGAVGSAVGEVCFNTSMTGYQEILTDPSYAGQIITFTFPHIGNVGTNEEDIETTTVAARGLVLRDPITEPANFRSTRPLDDWLKSRNLIGITGVDTRRLTRRIRLGGAPKGIVCHAPEGKFDIDALLGDARAWPGLLGMDLVKDVSCTQTYIWDQTLWTLGAGYGKQTNPKHHVVAVDYGIKRNILRCLASNAARLTVVPGN
jgi:carbamoyl-phosphate synthase small subunit